MFLFCLFNPLLEDCTQYWANWEQNDFVKETLAAINHLTPFITESASKRLKLREKSFGVQWDIINKVPTKMLIRWPIQILIYGNNFAWEWSFEPPDCPLRPVNPAWDEEEKEELLNKFDFFSPKRRYNGTSLKKAQQQWAYSDEIWLNHAFDLMNKSVADLVNNPSFGKSCLKWCKENGYNPPIFARNNFHSYNQKVQKVVPINDESFIYLYQTITNDWEPVKNNMQFNVHCHQQKEISPLITVKHNE